jgi:hypothetical protein
MITLKGIVNKLGEIVSSDGRLNDFIVCGSRSDLLADVKWYPYMAVILEPAHDILYSDVNGYRTIEYNVILRFGDKNNNQKNVYRESGLNSNNGLDIISDMFVILTDVVNCISEDSLDLFNEISLVNDLSAEPFYNEDSGDVNGYEVQLTFRVKNDNPCISPITAL